MKSPIGLIFCKNMLMDSLQGQLKNGLAEVIFLWVIWVKLFEKAFHKSQHSEEKSDQAEILQQHALWRVYRDSYKIVWLMSFFIELFE